jgi:hypothetical protein
MDLVVSPTAKCRKTRRIAEFSQCAALISMISGIGLGSIDLLSTGTFVMDISNRIMTAQCLFILLCVVSMVHILSDGFVLFVATAKAQPVLILRYAGRSLLLVGSAIHSAIRAFQYLDGEQLRAMSFLLLLLASFTMLATLSQNVLKLFSTFGLEYIRSIEIESKLVEFNNSARSKKRDSSDSDYTTDNDI